jgi:hypothetical protein
VTTCNREYEIDGIVTVLMQALSAQEDSDTVVLHYNDGASDLSGQFFLRDVAEALMVLIDKRGEELIVAARSKSIQ